jgi:hypothetical protein
MNQIEYFGLLEPAQKLVEQKGQDYNQGPSLHQYFPFGDASYVQMIYLKALRLVSLMEQFSPNFEGKLDTVYDLVNYCVFYLQYLEDQREDV